MLRIYAIHPHAAARHSRGFSMVEAMVALVVLAVGMLGIAGLFVMTLRAGGNAIYRMQAVNLAQDIADRIRANKTAVAAYAGAGANNNCEGPGSVNCTPPLLAANDVATWTAQITAALPGGAGLIVVTPPAVAGQPATYSITVSWVEQGQSAGQTALPLAYNLNMQT